MLSEPKLEIAKDLLESGKIKTFRDLFLYVPKTGIAKELGVNYGRFLGLIKKPGRLRYDESIAIARIFHVSPQIISQIILTQLEQTRLSKAKGR